MKKRTFEATCTVENIGKVMCFKREGKPNLHKVDIKLITSDNQHIYGQIRGKRISQLENKNISVGDTVQVFFIFHGVEFKGKTYNNVYICSINKIENIV